MHVRSGVEAVISSGSLWQSKFCSKRIAIQGDAAAHCVFHELVGTLAQPTCSIRQSHISPLQHKKEWLPCQVESELRAIESEGKAPLTCVHGGCVR